jgi:hypothetical protein
MLVENAKHAPLSQAVSRTFDGSHPCSLCHLVNRGKNSEQKPEFQQTVTKIDMICAIRAVLPAPKMLLLDYETTNLSPQLLNHCPPAPPPRGIVV